MIAAHSATGKSDKRKEKPEQEVVGRLCSAGVEVNFLFAADRRAVSRLR